MANLLLLLLVSSITTLSAVSPTLSAAHGQNPNVNFTISVNVSKGEDRFEKDIGQAYALQTMKNSTKFVQDTLVYYNKTVKKVSLFIQDTKGVVVANTTGNQIYVNVSYIQGYVGKSVKTEFTGILYNKMTLVWLLNRNGKVPEIVANGVADYVRLISGNAPKAWAKQGKGKRWNQSSEVTAKFFYFCEYVTHGFVKELCYETNTNSFDINNVFGTHFDQTLQTMWGYYIDGLPP